MSHDLPGLVVIKSPVASYRRSAALGVSGALLGEAALQIGAAAGRVHDAGGG